MSMAHLDWLLQAVLVLAIVVALPVAIRLERALTALRRDRAQLADSAQGFASATREAETAIARLRAAAEGAGRGMAEQVQTAAALRDDLRFLCERAGQLADRLEAALRTARPGAPEAEPARATPPVPRARAEAELLRAIGRSRGA
jgi:hypothetical protein